MSEYLSVCVCGFDLINGPQLAHLLNNRKLVRTLEKSVYRVLTKHDVCTPHAMIKYPSAILLAIMQLSKCCVSTHTDFHFLHGVEHPSNVVRSRNNGYGRAIGFCCILVQSITLRDKRFRHSYRT